MRYKKCSDTKTTALLNAIFYFRSNIGHIIGGNIKNFIIGGGIGGIVGYAFYHSIIGIILLLPYSIIYVKNKNKDSIKQQKWQLNLQFKDALVSLSSALNAGYSLENSIGETMRDLSLVYDKESRIRMELQQIHSDLDKNKPLEQCLQEFSKRCGVEDISNYVNVVIASKQTGGDIIKLTKATLDTIHDKIEVKREIVTLVAAKQLEANIMCVIPIGILYYLNLCSPGFLDPIYEGIVGSIFMSVLLFIYYGCYRMGKRIVDIQI